jgi:hypothetical protein
MQFEPASNHGFYSIDDTPVSGFGSTAKISKIIISFKPVLRKEAGQKSFFCGPISQ